MASKSAASLCSANTSETGVVREWSCALRWCPILVGGEKRGMGQVTIRDLWAKTQKGLVKIQTSMGLTMTWQHHLWQAIFTPAQSMNQRICDYNCRPDLKIVRAFHLDGRILCPVSCVLVRVNCWHFGCLTADKVIASVRLYARLWGKAGEVQRDVDQ